MNNQIKTFPNQAIDRLSFLCVGLYAWVVTVSFGAIVLDIVNSGVLHKAVGAIQTGTVFSEVADFLLLIGGATILAAIATIRFSWKSALARNLFIASLLIIIIKFLVPVLFFQVFQNAPVIQELGVGPWTRLTTSGLASILAFVGLYEFYRQR